MTDNIISSNPPDDVVIGLEQDPIVREIIELQREYFTEKRNVKTERQRKLKEIIERHVRLGNNSNDT